jgi:ankyrin repeat protein
MSMGRTYISYAAQYGNLDVMKWLLKNKCPWDERAFCHAAFHGDIGNMKWMHQNGCPWDETTFTEAARNGNIDNMKWLVEKGCPWDEGTFSNTDTRDPVQTHFLFQWLKNTNNAQVE